MTLVLSLETATDVCSVALHKEGQLVQDIELHEPQSHASRLATFIDDLFQRTKISPKELAAVAVSSGPGSYTGLRIGVSTAKGLCYGLGIPLISVDTLSLIAYEATQQYESDSYFCPMIDARRMEVYCMLVDRKLTSYREVWPEVVSEESFVNELDERGVVFFGNGSTKCEEIIHHPRATFLPNIFPRASNLGVMAYQKLKLKQFEDINTFTPFYLKAFQAKMPKSYF